MSSSRLRAVTAVVATAVASLAVPLLLTTSSAAASASVAAAAAPADAATGAICQPGQGVTVVVDFAPADDADYPDTDAPLTIACAVGQQTTIGAAAQAAGFTLTPSSGFLCEIDGVVAEPVGCSAWPGAYWSILISTTDGLPGGTPATEWSSAQVGIDGGVVPVDTAVLFQIQPYVEDWTGPEDNRQPRIPLADLGDFPGDGSVTPPTYPPSSDPDAGAAAGWLGRQLAAGGDVLANPADASITDWGLTQDALLALASAGVGKDQIDATAAKVYASGDDYIGAPDAVDGKWAAIAKTSLTLQVAGLDPTTFPAPGGTRNLITELRGTQNADGSFGASDFPFTHALALFTLSRTDGGVPAATVDWLQDQQCTTAGDAFGAYGYAGCDGVDVDGTALAVQALIAAGVPAADPSIADAQTWLIAQQQDSGALPSSYGGPNTNSTGLGAQTFLALGRTGNATAAAGYIGSLQLSCDVIEDNDALADDTVGAIGYDAAGFADALEYGLDAANTDQWARATSQGILGLGGPAFASITAAGAAADLPADEACVPPTTPTTAPTTVTSTAPTTAPTTVTTAPTTSASSTATTAPTTASSTPATSTAAPATPVLTVSPGEVAPGGQIRVSVSGAPAGASLPVELRSDPVVLGDLAIGADGSGSATFVIPSTTEEGVHHVVVSIDGVEYSAELVLRLELAATGVTEATLPMTVTGAALLLGGVGVLLLARTRRPLGRHRP